MQATKEEGWVGGNTRAAGGESACRGGSGSVPRLRTTNRAMAAGAQQRYAQATREKLVQAWRNHVSTSSGLQRCGVGVPLQVAYRGGWVDHDTTKGFLPEVAIDRASSATWTTTNQSHPQRRLGLPTLLPPPCTPSCVQTPSTPPLPLQVRGHTPHTIRRPTSTSKIKIESQTPKPLQYPFGAATSPPAQGVEGGPSGLTAAGTASPDSTRACRTTPR